MNRKPGRADRSPPSEAARGPSSDAPAPAGSPGANEASTVPAIVAGSFTRLAIPLRARMLGRLLASVGPLALAVAGGGAFAKYVAMARWPEVPVSFDDAARTTSTQIYELVRYVEQSNPQVFSQLLNLLARDTTTMAALGASIAALGISRLAPRIATRHAVPIAAGKRAARRKSGPAA